MKISVACATNRNLDQCLRSMINLAALSETPGFEVVISDTSGDLKKEDYFLSRASNGLKYLKNKPTTAFKNMLAALNHCTGDYASFIGDDDLILPLESFDANKTEIPDHAIGFRPTMFRVNPQKGIVNTSTFTVEGTTPVERCMDFRRKHGYSGNLSFYSFFKTQFLKDFYHAFVTNRPNIWTPCDWPLTFGLLSAGSLIQNERILFFYNDRNWSDSATGIETRLSYVRKQSLPDNYIVFDNLINGIDAFVAVCYSKPTCSETDMITAANYLCGSFFNSFVLDCKNITPALPVESLPSFNLITEGPLLSRIIAATEAIGCLVPSLESQYKLFLSTMVDPRVKRHLGFR